MIILAFSDLHEQLDSFNKLKKKAKNADIIICAGDMSIFEEALEEVMKKIAGLGKKTFVIHGNHEVIKDVKAECRNYPNLFFCHKKIFRINDDISIVGYGGGGFCEEDKEFEKFIKKNKKKLTKKNILVTHAPPYGTLLDNIMDDSVGNKSIKKFLNLFDIAISGHIHETAGKKETVNDTLIINPGPSGRILRI